MDASAGTLALSGHDSTIVSPMDTCNLRLAVGELRSVKAAIEYTATKETLAKCMKLNEAMKTPASADAPERLLNARSCMDDIHALYPDAVAAMEALNSKHVECTHAIYHAKPIALIGGGGADPSSVAQNEELKNRADRMIAALRAEEKAVMDEYITPRIESLQKRLADLEESEHKRVRANGERCCILCLLCVAIMHPPYQSLRVVVGCHLLIINVTSITLQAEEEFQDLAVSPEDTKMAMTAKKECAEAYLLRTLQSYTDEGARNGVCGNCRQEVNEDEKKTFERRVYHKQVRHYPGLVLLMQLMYARSYIYFTSSYHVSALNIDLTVTNSLRIVFL